jgi:hypothetical protein
MMAVIQVFKNSASFLLHCNIRQILGQLFLFIFKFCEAKAKVEIYILHEVSIYVEFHITVVFKLSKLGKSETK